MANRAVHWHEGMFLGPQHLQASQRYEAGQRRKAARWAQHYNWGLRALELDQTALANYRLEVRALKACLRDGTLVDLPEDGPLPALDLRGAFEKDRSLMVQLALPALQVGRANASPSPAGGVRYVVDQQEVEDENTGVGPQPVQFRLLNVKVLASAEKDHAGYEVLPLARVDKSPDADTTPRLDQTYIPPLLACDAWPPLQLGILRTIYDRVGTKIDLLAGQVRSRGIGVESHAPEDIRIIGQLRALNEASALLNILAFAGGIHPLEAYLELCRLVGQLAIFGDERRPPDLPRYDHDDLGYCFYTVKKYIDALLGLIVEPDWQQRAFVGAGLRMQVSLEPVWLEPAWEMYVGVRSSLAADQAVKLLTTSGILNMKIGSSDRVDQIFEYGQVGLKFTHRPQPRSLPALPGLVYLQVDRAAQPPEWQHVQRSLTLAIRLNEHRIAGSIQGEEVLTIRHDSQSVPMRFTLYVTRPPAASRGPAAPAAGPPEGPPPAGQS